MAPGMMLPAEKGEEPDAAPRDDWRLPPPALWIAGRSTWV